MQSKTDKTEITEQSSAVSVIFRSGINNRTAGWRQIFELLDHNYIRQIFFKGSWQEKNAFITFVTEPVNSDIVRKFNLNFQFLPDIKKYLETHIDQTGEIIQPWYFSDKRFTIKHKGWGQDIFFFHNLQPEINTIKFKQNIETINLVHPESVVAVYSVAENGPLSFTGNKIADITKVLNRENGTLKLKGKINNQMRILVIRRCLLRFENGFHFSFNYFNSAHLSRLQKAHKNDLKQYFRYFSGICYDLSDFFPEDNFEHFIPQSDALDQFAVHFYGKNLKELHALSILSGKERDNAVQRVYNHYFNLTLYPKLNFIVGVVHFFIDADNSNLSLINLSYPVIFCIDESRFYPASTYFMKVITNLRRAACQRRIISKSNIFVSIFDLFNLFHAFAEKKYYIDLLLINGATHFCFNYPDVPVSLNQQISGDKMQRNAYNKWFSYIHQLSQFLKQGVHRPELLLLYPSSDTEHHAFHDTLQTINRIGLDFELIDFKHFNSDKICRIETKRLLIKKTTFKIVILPAIDTIPLKTLDRLKQFMENGGVIIALGKLPQRSDATSEMKQLESLKKDIWFEEGGSSSTMFKQHESGGSAHFQKDISKLSDVLAEFADMFNVKMENNKESVIYHLRETEEAYHLFLMNINETETIRFNFSTRYTGKPYRWDFNLARREALAFRHFDDRRLVLDLKLNACESKMIIIDKREPADDWQLIAPDLDYCRIQQNENKQYYGEGLQRNAGRYKAFVADAQRNKYLKYQVGRKLPVLAVKPGNWLLKCKDYQGEIDLGDLSLRLPYQEEPVMYNKIIVLKDDYFDDYALILDLGRLNAWCAVYVNDTFVEQRIFPPWRFDISNFVRKDENKITILIGNNLTNKLAESTDSNYHYIVQDYGLYGPVRIIPYKKINLAF